MSSVGEQYRIMLYVDSVKPKTSVVVERLRELCKKHLTSPYTMEVIDLRKNPLLFEQRRIIAVPTMDVISPGLEQHRFVGDLSISESFIIAIGMYQDAEEMKRNAGEMEQKISHLRKKNKIVAQDSDRQVK